MGHALIVTRRSENYNVSLIIRLLSFSCGVIQNVPTYTILMILLQNKITLVCSTFNIFVVEIIGGEGRGK